MLRIPKLISRNEVTEGTMAFALARPTAFDFRAGQYMVAVLPNPPHTDAEGNRRVFSIASPPQDTTRLLMATRMTGTALKRSLAEVPLGTPVDLSGPAWDFVLHEDASRPAVFIAGGIGIMPFRAWCRMPSAGTSRIGSRSFTRIARRKGRHFTRNLSVLPGRMRI